MKNTSLLQLGTLAISLVITAPSFATSPAVPVAGTEIKSLCDKNSRDYDARKCMGLKRSSASHHVPVGGTKIKSKCDPNSNDYDVKQCKGLRKTLVIPHLLEAK